MGVAQAAAVDAAEAGDELGQVAHRVGGLAVVAQHEHVHVHFGHGQVGEQHGGHVVERGGDARLRQQQFGLLGGAALGDGQRERALLVEAERVHAVDDDLPGELVAQRRQQVAVAVPRDRDQHDVRVGGAVGVVRAPHVATGDVDDLLGRQLGSLGAAGADDHLEARLGPADREALALGSGAAQDADGEVTNLCH